MKHLDFDWDLDQNGIILDDALDLKKLKWEPGDYFKLVTVEGRSQLIKVDPIQMFLEKKSFMKER
jgi:hypothetical protein